MSSSEDETSSVSSTEVESLDQSSSSSSEVFPSPKKPAKKAAKATGKAKKSAPAPPVDTSDSESVSSSYGGYNDESSTRVQEAALEFSVNPDGTQPPGEKTRVSMDGVTGSPFAETAYKDDPRLDPTSDQFNSRFWIKNLKGMMEADQEYYKPTSLGVAYKNLRATGLSADADYQATFLNAPFKILGMAYDAIAHRNDESRMFDILKPMSGLIKSGTVTVVLGRPGAGCTTFLKSIASHTYGFNIAPESIISYDGISPQQIKKHYRGDVTYSAETDVHFPHLTVGQTLEFAARLRVPQNRPPGIDREAYAKHLTQVYMATYGLSHTYNTKVGNELVRGVSGGERKRVSIAEVSLCGSYLQCWDNATRGLDAATALEFIRALRTSADVLDVTSLIAIYQCSQDAFELFDNCILLYEGYQIYSGPANKAKDYFIKMGYECIPRQTTPDFLTSITNPAERVVRQGYAKKVPRTPKQFYDYWNTSQECESMEKEVDEYIADHVSNNARGYFAEAHNARQASNTRAGSSFTVSYWMQIRAIIGRNFLRIKGDPSINLMSIIGNIIMSLILSSLFYNLSPNTGSFYYRGAAMFFGVLFNCFSSLLEIMSLFESRPIVEKHKQYALYHPSADALGSIFTELPGKIIINICFNLIYYFMVNFRRDAGHFFLYLLFCILGTLSMSHLFRTVGSYFKTLSEAMVPASIMLLALSLYAGFAIPTTNMHKALRWINYINPVAYVFETLMSNEFEGREFGCTTFLPSGGPYDTVNATYKVCNTVGSVAGQSSVNGDVYLKEAYDYYWSHTWRNFGIVVGFIIIFLATYLLGVEFNRGAMQKGEITLFQRKNLKKLRQLRKQQAKDVESGAQNGKLEDYMDGSLARSQEHITKVYAGKDIFHWRDVSYDVQIGKETRRILNNVSGWIKPGTLTALMGASGAGKTTLLDVLASRVTTGVVYGHMFVNGHERDESFQRSTGYVQQQDLHLQTSTVREALRFSAILRQPASVSLEEKYEYVESVIKILEMERYADAVVGVAGEGLNVEQRKRLTIGVELAAKPKLLLFFDEPTSGLDSQTAWSICQLMRKLADNGQAIVAVLHQPSALLMNNLDRLLLLQKGGKTVYFGDLGQNCQTLIDYFEAHGAHHCPEDANPAEWMLHVIGAAPGSHANQDYHEVWLKSKEYKAVRKELASMERDLVKLPRDNDEESHREYAAGFWTQYRHVTKRVLEQYYRTPYYLWSKIYLTVISALFNGFTFYNNRQTLQGMQNMMLSTFMFTVVINPLIQQMLPHFVYQRALYEARERPSKMFSWIAWILAQISAEIPWHIFNGTLGFFCWYYPVGFYSNAEITHTVAARGALTWLYVVVFYIFIGTFGQMAAAAADGAENGGNLASMMFTMALNFCGVLKYPSGFWIWMYYISPFTYWIQGIMSTTLANTPITCAPNELVSFPPYNGTCGDYMGLWIDNAGGYLVNTSSTTECEFCTMANTNVFLSSIHSQYDQRWRNWGIFICYIAINVIFCLLFYWLARVPKGKQGVKVQEAKNDSPSASNEQQLDENEPASPAAAEEVVEAPKRKKKRAAEDPEPETKPKRTSSKKTTADSPAASPITSPTTSPKAKRSAKKASSSTTSPATSPATSPTTKRSGKKSGKKSASASPSGTKKSSVNKS